MDDKNLSNEYINELIETKAKKEAEKNIAEGKKFLEDNAKRDGVTVTDSGLQYEVLSEGKGDKPKAEDVVTVHYVGTLIDGTEFDSSIARGEPTSFPLNQVIPGWTEGVQLMPVGAKYKFVIPSDLAYGENGASTIPGNAVLVFEVELLDIEASEQSATEANSASEQAADNQADTQAKAEEVTEKADAKDAPQKDAQPTESTKETSEQ